MSVSVLRDRVYAGCLQDAYEHFVRQGPPLQIGPCVRQGIFGARRLLSGEVQERVPYIARVLVFLRQILGEPFVEYRLGRSLVDFLRRFLGLSFRRSGGDFCPGSPELHESRRLLFYCRGPSLGGFLRTLVRGFLSRPIVRSRRLMLLGIRDESDRLRRERGLHQMRGRFADLRGVSSQRDSVRRMYPVSHELIRAYAPFLNGEIPEEFLQRHHPYRVRRRGHNVSDERHDPQLSDIPAVEIEHRRIGLSDGAAVLREREFRRSDGDGIAGESVLIPIVFRRLYLSQSHAGPYVCVLMM